MSDAPALGSQPLAGRGPLQKLGSAFDVARVQSELGALGPGAWLCPPRSSSASPKAAGAEAGAGAVPADAPREDAKADAAEADTADADTADTDTADTDTADAGTADAGTADADAAEAAAVLALLPLVTVGGGLAQGFANAGAMSARPALRRCPYLARVLDQVAGPVSRSFAVRFRPEQTWKEDDGWQASVHFHYLRRAQLVLVAGAPVDVEIRGEPPRRQTLRPGEVWALDATRPHRWCATAEAESAEAGSADAILIQADTRAVGWSAGPVPTADPDPTEAAPTASHRCEPFGVEVLTPGELAGLTQVLRRASALVWKGDELARVERALGWLEDEWGSVYAALGESAAALDALGPVVHLLGAKLPFDFASRLPPQARRALTFLHTGFDRLQRPILVAQRGGPAAPAGPVQD